MQGDFVEGAMGATETTETDLGDIVIPSSGISKVVGVYGQIVIQTTTAAEGTGGYFRLAFKSVSGTFRYPATIFQGAAGTLADIGPAQSPQIIPVDISVPPNETIGCYIATFLAQTGTCRGMIGVLMH